jgi:hypothetical protein
VTAPVVPPAEAEEFARSIKPLKTKPGTSKEILAKEKQIAEREEQIALKQKELEELDKKFGTAPTGVTVQAPPGVIDEKVLGMERQQLLRKEIEDYTYLNSYLQIQIDAERLRVPATVIIPYAERYPYTGFAPVMGDHRASPRPAEKPKKKSAVK